MFLLHYRLFRCFPYISIISYNRIIRVHTRKMDVMKIIREFFSYWYLRYLVATELYMVEPWEKNFIHTLFVIIFGLFWYFNCSIVRSIAHVRNTLTDMEIFS